jgi:hypothetical protein
VLTKEEIEENEKFKIVLEPTDIFEILSLIEEQNLFLIKTI